MTNPDTTAQLVARGNAIEAIMNLYFEDLAGDAVGLSVGISSWTDTGKGALSLTRAERSRGWADLNTARQLAYCPVILAAATAPLPSTGNGSLASYLELVHVVWNAEILAFRQGLDAPGRREAAMNDLASIADGAAVQFMSVIEQTALDGMLGTEVGDDLWARELGLL